MSVDKRILEAFEHPFHREIRHQHIVFAVSDWGLGHASRSAVLIDRLSKNNTVTIASSGIALQWLEARFATLSFLRLPSYNIKYRMPFRWLDMIWQGPNLLMVIREEQKIIIEYCKKNSTTLILSDHRWGCHFSAIPSIFIGHQLNIPLKSMSISKIINRLHARMINPFNLIWVPDTDGFELSGIMASNPYIDVPARSIGLLSHMRANQDSPLPTQHAIVVILSGPEPIRTSLENSLMGILSSISWPIIFIRGTDERSEFVSKKDWVIINVASQEQIRQALMSASLVISRTGYSTIMDLWQMKSTCVLIPTPGHPEQEYLAMLHFEHPKWKVIRQNQLERELLTFIKNWNSKEAYLHK